MPGIDRGPGRAARPVDVGPRRVGYRRQLAIQVVHGRVLLFRLPIPREPLAGDDGPGPLGPAGPPELAGPGVLGAPGAADASGRLGRLSRKSADGAKNRVPVTAVEKSRIRS